MEWYISLYIVLNVLLNIAHIIYYPFIIHLLSIIIVVHMNSPLTSPYYSIY